MPAVQPSTSDGPLPARRMPVALVMAVALAVALVGAALVLWAHYGTTVFFEMIAAGIAACF